MNDPPDRSAIFRIKKGFGTGDKVVAWFQLRSWFFFRRWWFPVSNRHTGAKHDFVEAFRKCEESLRLVDATKDDEAKALAFVDRNRARDGVSTWFPAKWRPREEVLPECKDFDVLRKRFETGAAPTRRQRQRGEGSERTAYTLSKVRLPHEVFEADRLAGMNHSIQYDEKRAKEQSSKRSKGNRSQNQQNRHPHGRKVTIDLGDED